MTRCPVCDAPVPAAATGRPRVFCTDEHRGEMRRRRRRLEQLEAALAGRRRSVRAGTVWGTVDMKFIRWLERDVEHTRRAVEGVR